MAAIVRLDEKVGRAGTVGQGLRARSFFREACAIRALAGQPVPLENLVLVEAGASIRIGTIELTRACTALQALRPAADHPPTWACTDASLFDDRLRVDRNDLFEELTCSVLLGHG